MLRREVLSLATALVFLLSSGIAVAQDATTPPAATVVGEQPAATAAAVPEERTEEIVVTGTRIRRKDLTTPAPVTVISRDQIAASGKITIGDFLQALPEQGNAINTQFNNSGDGSTRVSLRSMGSTRTLVLINGRRVVAGGTGADASVDLNSIPSQAIERIEIQKDGASAVYGSDAIAGVVNLITRKNLSGSNVAAFAGQSGQGDGTIYDLNVTAGTSGDRGNVLFSAGYFKQTEIWAGDRDYSKTAFTYDYLTGSTFPGGSSAIPAGRVTIPTSCNTAKCQEIRAANGGSAATLWKADPTNPSGFSPYSGATDSYNFQPENYLSTPQERIQLFAIGDTKLGDSARGFFEASYVNRQSAQKLAPEPLFTISNGLVLSADSYYNPFGVNLTDVRRRLVEFGNRNFTQDIDTFRLIAGVDGTLPESLGPLAGWFWDTSFSYGRTAGVDQTQGTLRAPYVGSAIGPSFLDPTDNVVKCGDPGADGIPGTLDDNLVPNCTPLDLLGGAGSITQDQVAGLGFTGADRGTNGMSAFSVNTSGDLFQLLGDRPVGLGLGYEYRELSGSSQPNPISAAFENSGNNFAPTKGSYNVNEVYGELVIPIVSNMPGAQDIEATLAARYFDYSTFGSDSTYKIGARWRVIPDFTVRGTYSTAFRAPNIPELFDGNTDSFPQVSDPCRGTSVGGPPVVAGTVLGDTCIAQGVPVGGTGDDRTQLKERLGGNPDLEPETAKIFTVGAVFEPRMVKNFSATLDYYSIDLDQAITFVGAGTILQSCYTTGQFCGLINRTPGTGLVDFIDDRNVNVGGIKTAGLDFALRYALPTNYGRFGFVFDGTWLQKFDQTLADGTVIEGKGTYDLEDILPAFKFNAGVNWGWKGFGAGLSTRFIGSSKECANADGISGADGLCYIDDANARRVKPWATTDLFVSYTLNSGAGRTNIALGMQNVFDDNPAIVFNGFLASSDAATYDYIGRYMYARLEHSY